MREERGQIGGDVVVYEPFTLWGSIGGKVTVVQGGKLYVRGAIYGDMIVEFGGRVHVLGSVTGDITIHRGAKVIHSGMCGGNLVNEGGRLTIDANARIMGKVRNKEGAETKDQRKPA